MTGFPFRSTRNNRKRFQRPSPSLPYRHVIADVDFVIVAVVAVAVVVVVFVVVVVVVVVVWCRLLSAVGQGLPDTDVIVNDDGDNADNVDNVGVVCASRTHLSSSSSSRTCSSQCGPLSSA